MTKRLYLGDGVYVSYDGYMIELVTIHDGSTPDNTIYLEPKVLESFFKYVEHVFKVKIDIKKQGDESEQND